MDMAIGTGKLKSSRSKTRATPSQSAAMAKARAAAIEAKEARRRLGEPAYRKKKPIGFGDLPANWKLTLEEFSDRSGLGKAAMRKARQSGLVVRAVGNQRYVMERDWHSFLETCPNV